MTANGHCKKTLQQLRLAVDSVAVLDLLFPPVCLGCERLVACAQGPLSVCATCKVEMHRLPVDNTVPAAIYAYDGPLRRALHRLKYQRDIAVAGPLGAALSESPLLAPTAGFDIIAPVPLHPSRQRRRGFNQCWLLLRAAVRTHTATRRRLQYALLRRSRATPAQVKLSAADRWTNVQGAFVLAPRFKDRVRGRAVLLVDDVATTGATLAACRAVLEGAGARVTTLALMRTVA